MTICLVECKALRDAAELVRERDEAREIAIVGSAIATETKFAPQIQRNATDD